MNELAARPIWTIAMAVEVATKSRFVIGMWLNFKKVNYISGNII
jgi:hypothetical protein